LRGQISVTAWKPPEDMPEPEWIRAGVVLRKLEQGIGWWLGDWYGFGERRYGKRKAIVNAPDWQGPNYQTCRNTLVVCAAFELSRRRYNLSFKHHAEVASLAPADADELLDWCEEPLRAGEREPRSTRELRAAVVEHRNRSRLLAIAEHASLFPTDTYSIIYADPPWEYDHPISTTRRIENHYPTMSIDAICLLPVASITAERAMLFMWAPPSFVRKAIRVIEAWGFEYETQIIWDKGRDGMGYYVRQRHENLFIAHRGEALVPPPSTLPSSVIAAPREEHSRKPAIFRQVIERMYPCLPKIELFSREAVEGWSNWGNQELVLSQHELQVGEDAVI